MFQKTVPRPKKMFRGAVPPGCSNLRPPPLRPFDPFGPRQKSPPKTPGPQPLRCRAGMAVQTAYILGELTLAGLAAIPQLGASWRALNVAVALLMLALPCGAAALLMPESPRCGWTWGVRGAPRHQNVACKISHLAPTISLNPARHSWSNCPIDICFLAPHGGRLWRVVCGRGGRGG
jgi:hypothetical protein